MESAPIFIGGINRTGTSLARRLIGSHPLVAMPPTELEFFKRLGKRGSSTLDRDGALELASEVLLWPKVADWQLDAEDVTSRVAAGEHSVRGVFVALLRSYAARAGKPRWGEKTTSYERHLKTLDRWFDGNLVFAHMIRHPVSAYASACWYDGIERKIDVRDWVDEWRRSVLTALTTEQRLEPRYVVVRYEDLVRGTEQELARICAAAALSYDPQMLTMADFRDSENSSFAGAEGRYHGKVRQADTVRRAERIPSDALLYLTSTCRRLAGLVGYDVADETVLLPVPPRQPLALLRLADSSRATRSFVRRARARALG
jgi:hypothetical protein